ncbi:tryptophan dimethylallyltransferase family protein [Streptomyces sp. NPDC048481]|uniref:tryptophan dimethylallyltransferase family protein n=1 Tax=Streptomyces sp. NPDC048481 TaxID=3365557 RepID=UPI003714412D
MTAPRPGGRGVPPAATLGGHAARQLLRLGESTGLSTADTESYARTLVDALGPVALRPLDLPAPSRSFLSDDHTLVEFSVSCEPGAAPSLRVLIEPGAGEPDLAHNGRTGLRVLRDMGRRWGFTTGRLDELEDLFFPASPHGPLALWCALELRPGGVPKVKAYLNPAAAGPERAAKTVRKALKRLGHRQAFASLPDTDRHLFFALDLGDWAEPRAKVYLAHDDLSATQAGALCRMDGGPDPAEIEDCFRIAAGHDGASAPGGPEGDADGVPAGKDGAGPRIVRRPVQTCHAFTDTGAARPSGFTLYVPVRDHAPHDGEALVRAAALLGRYGLDPAPVLRAPAALTERRPEDGVGLVAYLGVAHQHGRPPRVTTYLSSEAYEVRPPAPAPAPAARRAGSPAVAVLSPAPQPAAPQPAVP